MAIKYAALLNALGTVVIQSANKKNKNFGSIVHS